MADSEALEILCTQWVEAPDQSARQAIARRLQEQAFTDVPYIPTGQWRNLTAYRRNLTGMLTGMPLFYNLQKG